MTDLSETSYVPVLTPIDTMRAEYSQVAKAICDLRRKDRTDPDLLTLCAREAELYEAIKVLDVKLPMCEGQGVAPLGRRPIGM